MFVLYELPYSADSLVLNNIILRGMKISEINESVELEAHETRSSSLQNFGLQGLHCKKMIRKIKLKQCTCIKLIIKKLFYSSNLDNFLTY